jgi:hypothetical protein
MRTTVKTTAEAFRQHAPALAAWFWARVVVRHDVFGAYTSQKTQYTAHECLTIEMLVRHFKGEWTIGVHSTSPDGKCLWVAFDIDAHDDRADAGVNWRCALKIVELLKALDLVGVIFDSNGAGGYHVRAFLKKPIPVEVAHWLCRRIAASLDADGFGKVETFPKQGAVTLECPYGNWLRLPGKHHKRDVWTRVYDPDKDDWLEGTDLVKRIIGIAGDDPGPTLRAYREEREACEKADAPGNGKADRSRGVWAMAGGARGPIAEESLREALGHLSDLADDYDSWLAVGMALHDWDTSRGLPLWHEFSRPSGKYEAAVLDEKWATFTQGGGITVGTILHAATERGWAPPWKRSGSSEGNGDGHQGPPEKPRIICGFEDPEEGLKLWTPAALDSLAKANHPTPRTFQRGGVLSRIKVHDEGGPPTIEPLTPAALRGALDRAACWADVQITKKGSTLKFGPPRMDIVQDILALPSHNTESFPPIDLVVESPRFLPNGRLILKPGYSRPGRLFYAPPPELAGLDVPGRPTAKDVCDAVRLILDELLVDFPFANQASRANALAVALLPFVRLLIDGSTPDHHFTASTEGTGKGLCAAACAFPSLGRELDLHSQKEDEAEWRKALTSAFVAGGSHYFIDNMYNPLGWDDIPRDVDSGTLAMAWTTRYYSDRLLGGNKNARIKVLTVFMSSGNNVMFSRELKRRLVLIELVAPCENPSALTGFKHDPLLGWARENRLALTRACLLLCRHWIVEGMPAGDQVMGSFEVYARTMGGILGACGVEGFLANRPQAIARDAEADRWCGLVAEWHKVHQTGPVTTAELWKLIGENAALADSFSDLLGDGKPNSQKTKLGKALDRSEGRVWGDWRVTRCKAEARTGVALWRLRDPSLPADEAEAKPPAEELDFAATSCEGDDSVPF